MQLTAKVVTNTNPKHSGQSEVNYWPVHRELALSSLNWLCSLLYAIQNVLCISGGLYIFFYFTQIAMQYTIFPVLCCMIWVLEVTVETPFAPVQWSPSLLQPQSLSRHFSTNCIQCQAQMGQCWLVIFFSTCLKNNAHAQAIFSMYTTFFPTCPLDT